MGLELQVRGVTSAMPMNCAAAVTMAAGALQPACGCLISLILQHSTTLCEVKRPAWAQVPVPVKARQLQKYVRSSCHHCNLRCGLWLIYDSRSCTGLSPVPLHLRGIAATAALSSLAHVLLTCLH